MLAGLALVRRRRQLVAAASGVVGTGAAVVMSVMVVAVGGTPPPGQEGGPGAIPAVALDAYRRAAASPLGLACGLRWTVLAGVAKVESDHAGGRTIAPDGTVSPPIIGPVLDGSVGTARTPDTDGGRLDADATWDHAVGPLQFLPTTWAAVGTDANGDGVADPHNLYDAAQAAAGLLCSAGPLVDEAALRTALFAYNHSDTYVEAVLAWIATYDQAPLPGPGVEATGTLVAVGPIVVDSALAPDLAALVAAAGRDAVVLGGAGYRSRQAQIALRRAHCGASAFAVFEMPAGACRPPTARPGESLHEAGLAVDFTCAGVLVTRGDACFTWLVANAARYGLANLASEPWHWSTTGQ